jgi:hypothetical protein
LCVNARVTCRFGFFALVLALFPISCYCYQIYGKCPGGREKKILILAFCCIATFVYSQEKLNIAGIDSVNFRNRLLYVINEEAEPSVTYGRLLTKCEAIAQSDSKASNLENKLTKDQTQIFKSLIGYKVDIEANPNATVFIIHCNHEYGVLTWWWNDASPAIIMGVGPGPKVMHEVFFKIK